ncbi:MAG: hypothetical protein ACE5OP_09565 [Candidatus Glassbacteria bacterium]
MNRVLSIVIVVQLAILVVIAGLGCSSRTSNNPISESSHQAIFDPSLLGEIDRIAKGQDIEDVILASGGGTWAGDGIRICKGFFGDNVVCMFTKVTWRVVVVLRALDENGVQDIEIKDTFPAEYEIERYATTLGEATVEPVGGGNSATRVEWEVEDLPQGTTARLVMLVSTRLNPGGNQEFTSPGIYDLNPGVNAEWDYLEDDFEVEEILGLEVEAIECDS